MAINPSQKSKNQSLSLTGSNLYSWQSKPMQGRQPSGANAPRPPQGDFYKTPGVANRAGVPKAPTTTNPQSRFYGNDSYTNNALGLAMNDAPDGSMKHAVMDYSDKVKKLPGDMGIYGPLGSANRNAAEEKYMNFQGPSISKGPYRPDPNANPKDNIQLLNGMPRVPDDASKIDYESMRHYGSTTDSDPEYLAHVKKYQELNRWPLSFDLWKKEKLESLGVDFRTAQEKPQQPPAAPATQAPTQQQTKLNGDRPWEVNPWHSHVGEQHSISRGLKPGEGVDNTPTDVEIERRSRATDPDSVKLGYNIPRYLEEERGWLGMTKKEFDALPARRGRTQQQSPAAPSQPEGRAPAAPVNPNTNITEMFYGPNSRANALNAQDAAMAPQPKPQAPMADNSKLSPETLDLIGRMYQDPRLIPKMTGTAGNMPPTQSPRPAPEGRAIYDKNAPAVDPNDKRHIDIARPSDPVPMGNLGPGISDAMARKGDHTGGDYLEQAQSPWKPEFEQKVAKQWQDAYSKPTPAPADSTLNPEEQKWKSMGVSPAELEKLRSGQMSQAEWDAVKNRASQGKVDQFNTISPERQQQLDADIAMDRELAAKAASDAQRNLGFTGAIQNQDLVDRTNRQTDYYGQRRQSMDAMNKRLDEGGGLQYRQGSTGFGTPEQVSQDAASINALYGAEKAKQEAYNAEQDKVMADWKQTKAAKDQYLQDSKGIDPDKARKDINRLSGQFAAITKQRVAPGYKFVDFVQDEIRSGKVDPGAIKMIEENYGTTFDKTPSQQSGQSAPAQSALDLARQRAAKNQAATDSEQAKAQQQGRERRREQAAAQGAYRERAAALMGQGLSPQQAHQALARDKAMQDFYGANVAMETAQAQGQIGAAGLQANADMYRADKQVQDNAADRKLKSEQLAYDKEQTAIAKRQQILQQAEQLPGDINDINTPRGRYYSDQNAATAGISPANPLKAAQDTPADQRTPSQSKTIISHTINQLVEGGFKPEGEGAIITGMKKMKEAGLSPKEQAMGLSQLTGRDFTLRSDSSRAIKSMLDDATARATENSSGVGGNFNREFNTAVGDYMEVISLIGKQSGMTDKEIKGILAKHATQVAIQQGINPMAAAQQLFGSAFDWATGS